MGLYTQMYWLVSWVDSDIKKHDKNDPNVAKVGEKWRLSGARIRENYSKDSDKPHDFIRDLIETCIEEGFLKTEGEKKEWVYISPGKGRKFLRKPRGVPTGYFKEVISDNNLVISALAGVFGGVATILVYLWTKP